MMLSKLEFALNNSTRLKVAAGIKRFEEKYFQQKLTIEELQSEKLTLTYDKQKYTQQLEVC